MSNVKLLRPAGQDIPTGLRNIADQIEKGEFRPEHLTLTGGNRVFHLGTISDQQAAVNAVWDMNIGLSMLMLAAHGFDV